MTDRNDIPSDGPQLAAEYALGVLEGDELRIAQSRMASDPAFAKEVTAWAERLAPLAEAIPEAAPPSDLGARVDRALDRAAGAGAANDNTLGLRFWRGVAFAASGLAAASVAAVIVLLVRPAPPGPQVATLATPEGEAALVVALDPRSGDLLVSPAAGLQPAGATPHLWLMEPGGGVRLVGAIDPRRAATHHLPAELARRARGADGVAVSLEPVGRAPGAGPAGPVVASGEFQRL